MEDTIRNKDDEISSKDQELEVARCDTETHLSKIGELEQTCEQIESSYKQKIEDVKKQERAKREKEMMDRCTCSIKRH